MALLAEPLRCDAWDRLLLGMGLHAGEGFEPLDFHPYRDKETEKESESREKRARKRHEQRILDTPGITEGQKQAMLDKLEAIRSGN